MAAAAMAPIRKISLTTRERRGLTESRYPLLRLMNRMDGRGRTKLDYQTMLEVASFAACVDTILQLDARRKK